MTWRTGPSGQQSQDSASAAGTGSPPTGSGAAPVPTRDAPSSSLSVVIHGRPVSWNRAYRYGRGGAGGKARMYLTREAESWKEIVWATTLDAYNRSSWKPRTKGLIVIEWRLLLTDEVDPDNLTKLVHDAVASAIGVNDKRFMPRFMTKHTGMGHDVVSLRIYDMED